jgi:hypothetical protein
MAMCGTLAKSPVHLLGNTPDGVLNLRLLFHAYMIAEDAGKLIAPFRTTEKPLDLRS